MDMQDVVLKTHKERYANALKSGLCFAYGGALGSLTPKVIGWAVSTTAKQNFDFLCDFICA